MKGWQVNMLYKLIGRLRRLWRRLLGRNAVHYINGAEVLPPPLTVEEERAVLARLEEGDESARDTLITRNLRLVVYIARKFESSGVGLEDLISIGTIGLIKAVRTFCPGRNIKLATYSSRCIENEILMYLRKNAQKRSEISIDEPLNVDFDGNATSDVHFNPNDSMFAIEGITSPDGRVIGKMGHSERIGAGLYKNVPGEYDIRMFASAVKYFKG